MQLNPFKKKKSESLISIEYSELLKEKHSTDPEWGSSGVKFLDRVSGVINTVCPSSVLDYGCGKGALAEALHEKYKSLPIMLYDPGIEQHADDPHSADLVICTDVLEHVEPDLIDNVLSHIASLAKEAAYFVVHTGDCGHTLPDGRPAHILQQPRGWWEGKIIEAFDGFTIDFAEISDPHRFEVVAIKNGRPSCVSTDVEDDDAIKDLEKTTPADPEPDLSAIDALDSNPGSIQSGGILGGFGGTLKAKESE